MTERCLESYRGHTIVETGERPPHGYTVFAEGAAIVGLPLVRGLGSVEAARAKIDKLLDEPAQRRP